MMTPKEAAENLVKQWLLECWIDRVGDKMPSEEHVNKLLEVLEKEFDLEL